MILEGILARRKYGDMLRNLLGEYHGTLVWLDVPLEETLRRHRTRPQAAGFTGDDMRGWFNDRDMLGFDGEQVLPEATTLDDAVTLITVATGLPLLRADQPRDP